MGALIEYKSMMHNKVADPLIFLFICFYPGLVNDNPSLVIQAYWKEESRRGLYILFFLIPHNIPQLPYLPPEFSSLPVHFLVFQHPSVQTISEKSWHP